MPTYAGSPVAGVRSATPLLPSFLPHLYSQRNSKSLNSFSVSSHPPPPPLHTIDPPSEVQASALPVVFQQLRSLPLNRAVNPSGGRPAGGSSARTAPRHTAATSPTRIAVFMRDTPREIG